MKKKTSKKENLLQSAENLFEKYGYRKVSIDEIVQEAGVAKGTFYLYFKNKDEIYSRIVENYYQNEILTPAEEYAKKESDIRIRFYEDFIYGIHYLQERKILRELMLNNPNYFSESISYGTLLQQNVKLAKLLFRECREDLRSDLELEDLADAYGILMPVFFQEKNKEMFWRKAETLAKIFIDGFLSKHRWHVDNSQAVITKLSRQS